MGDEKHKGNNLPLSVQIDTYKNKLFFNIPDVLEWLETKPLINITLIKLLN